MGFNISRTVFSFCRRYFISCSSYGSWHWVTIRFHVFRQMLPISWNYKNLISATMVQLWEIMLDRIELCHLLLSHTSSSSASLCGLFSGHCCSTEHSLCLSVWDGQYSRRLAHRNHLCWMSPIVCWPDKKVGWPETRKINWNHLRGAETRPAGRLHSACHGSVVEWKSSHLKVGCCILKCQDYYLTLVDVIVTELTVIPDTIKMCRNLQVANFSSNPLQR